MPATSKLGNVCAFSMFLVEGNTRRATPEGSDDLPLGDCKAAYHLLMLQVAHSYCINLLQPSMYLCRAISPTSNQNEGGLDTAAHQVHTALIFTFAAAIAQAALDAMNTALALSDKPKGCPSETQACQACARVFIAYLSGSFVTL